MMITRVLLASCVLCVVACQDTSAPAVSNLPTKPETFFATPRTAEIVLQWQDLAKNESRYRVEVSSDGGPWIVLVDAPANTTTARHPGIFHGVTYSYRVAACNEAGCSDWVFASAKWQTGTAPVITSFTIGIVGARTATLRTNAQSSGLTTRFWFIVYKEGAPTPVLITERVGGVSSGSTENPGAIITTTYNLMNLDPLTQYNVFAYAENAIGQSSGEPKTFATSAEGPPVVSNMEAFVNLAREWFVRAAVNANGLNTTFRIEVIRAGESFERPWFIYSALIQGGTTPAAISPELNVEKGTTYLWRIIATNALGSVTSETATFTVQ